MAKYLVTGFTPESNGEVTATGIITDGDASYILSVWNVAFDHYSATPVRQQIDAVLADMVNQQLINDGRTASILTQADIEYLI